MEGGIPVDVQHTLRKWRNRSLNIISLYFIISELTSSTLHSFLFPSVFFYRVFQSLTVRSSTAAFTDSSVLAITLLVLGWNYKSLKYLCYFSNLQHLTLKFPFHSTQILEIFVGCLLTPVYILILFCIILLLLILCWLRLFLDIIYVKPRSYYMWFWFQELVSNYLLHGFAISSLLLPLIRTSQFCCCSFRPVR